VSDYLKIVKFFTFGSTGVFKKLKSPLIAIFGNNDGDRVHLKQFFSGIGEIYDDPYMGRINGKSITMTHKPEIVDSLASKYDVVLYGHTHERELKNEGGIVLNPGECCGYLTGKSTVALLDIRRMHAEITEL